MTMPTTPAPSGLPAPSVRDALAELVALYDLKRAIECWVRDEDTGRQWPKMPYAERMAACDDLDRRKPVALAAARAALAAAPLPASPEPQPGFRPVFVNSGFGALMDALDRADRKGYLPDAMADEWNAFDWREGAAPRPAQVAPSEPQPLTPGESGCSN